MSHDEALTAKEILRRTTILTSCAENLKSYLLNLAKISAPSLLLQSQVVATLELASLTTEAAHALQYAVERSFWTKDTTDLRSLSRHWRIASENLESLSSSLAGPELFQEIDP